eukprot:18655_1
MVVGGDGTVWVNAPAANNVVCATTHPSSNPTKRPTPNPTKRPTPNPTKRPTPNPTKRPTPNPTKRPTPNPTKRPTTKPTPNPTPRPTDPVGTSSCGDTVTGVYNGVPVTFLVTLPYEGDLQFDASASSFEVTDIEAFTKLNSPLGTDTDNDERVKLVDKPAGDYKFILNSDAASSGTFRATITCFSADPTPSPTKRPTNKPTKGPTKKPVVESVPTRAPTTKDPTKRPTKGPTKKPTTKDPTKRPTDTPTTPSPTQPPPLSCGSETVGAYTSGTLIFETTMSFTGDIFFDASNSNFDIAAIEGFTKLDSYLGSDSNGDGILTLSGTVAGDYKFVMVGTGGGIYHVKITCVSDAPTNNPTKRPTYAPVNHPITPHPSESTVPTLSPTEPPTKGPTTRPTLFVATPPPTSATTDSEEEDSGENGSLVSDADGGPPALRIAVYIVSGLMICVVCLCCMIVFHKYCLEKIDEIKKEMANLGILMAETGAPGHAKGIMAVQFRPQAEIDFDRDLVVQWMRHTVKLPQYTKKLFDQGYDNMRAIQAVGSREELGLCGIKPHGHQTLILAEIAALQGTQFSTKRGATHGEGGQQHMQLPPQPMAGGTWGLEYENGEGGLVSGYYEEEQSPVLNTPMGGHGGPPPPPMMMGPPPVSMMGGGMMLPPPAPVNVTHAGGIDQVYSDPESSSEDPVYGGNMVNDYKLTVEGSYKV